MNCVTLTGNLCKDLKIEYTRNGKAYLENTLGVAKERKDENGNRQSDFINFVCYENKAEYLSKYAKKGDKIEIVGNLRVDTWNDEQGGFNSKTYVVVDKIQILTSRIKNDEKQF